MKPPELKPCPFCGGEVSIASTGYRTENCFFITRGISKTKKNCKCRLFMESEPYQKGDDKELVDNVKIELVKAWNRRVTDD